MWLPSEDADGAQATQQAPPAAAGAPTQEARGAPGSVPAAPASQAQAGSESKQGPGPAAGGSPPRRPVIIFHEGGEWGDTSPVKAQPQSQPTAQAGGAGAGAGAGTGAPSEREAPGAKGDVLSSGLAQLGRLAGSSAAPSAAAGPPPTTAAAPPPSTTAQPARTTTAAQQQHPVSASVQAARAAGFSLWQRLLDVALNDPTIATEKFKFGSDVHRLKVPYVDFDTLLFGSAID